MWLEIWRDQDTVPHLHLQERMTPLFCLYSEPNSLGQHPSYMYETAIAAGKYRRLLLHNRLRATKNSISAYYTLYKAVHSPWVKQFTVQLDKTYGGKINSQRRCNLLFKRFLYLNCQATQ